MKVRRVGECPACGLPGGAEVVRLDNGSRKRFLELSERKYGGLMNSWVSAMDVMIVTCAACGHHWYRDQPDEALLAGLYDEGRPLSGTGVPASGEPSPYARREMRRLRRLIRWHGGCRKPTLLDYGSGSGRWTRAAIEAGFAVTAFEPSVVRAGASHGVTTVTDYAALGDRVFDCVNAEQVLEHVENPLETLRRIGQHRRIGSVLRVTVPNIERPAEGRAMWAEWPFNGRRMHTMAPFEHLHGFTPRSLASLVRRAGFVVLTPWQACAYGASHAARMIAGRTTRRLGTTKVLAVFRGAPPESR